MAYPTALSSPRFLPNRINSFPKFSSTNQKPSKFPTAFAIPPLSTATAADVSGAIDGTTIAVISGGSVAALAAVLSLTDPEKRRRLQAEEVGGDDKEVVKEYFNNSGFQRWKKIYGNADDVNRVQRDIRLGHSKTVENTLKMLKDEVSLQGVTICDAGCGTGSLSIPLAKEGAIVSASDISAAMVAEAEKQVSFQGFCSFEEGLFDFMHDGLVRLSGKNEALRDFLVCGSFCAMRECIEHQSRAANG